MAQGIFFKFVNIVLTRGNGNLRHHFLGFRLYSTTGEHSAAEPKTLSKSASTDLTLSKNDVVSPHIINRNPRNLEQMGFAKKRVGWALQYPSREFYHRLSLEVGHRYIKAWVEHCGGKIVVSASTNELAVSRFLYSTRDVSAARNIGRILAQRCLESGITCMMIQAPEQGENSEKFQAFKKAMEDGGVDLSEPEVYEPPFEPGINYDDPEVVKNLKERQMRVASSMSNMIRRHVFGFKKQTYRLVTREDFPRPRKPHKLNKKFRQIKKMEEILKAKNENDKAMDYLKIF